MRCEHEKGVLMAPFLVSGTRLVEAFHQADGVAYGNIHRYRTQQAILFMVLESSDGDDATIAAENDKILQVLFGDVFVWQIVFCEQGFDGRKVTARGGFEVRACAHRHCSARRSPPAAEPRGRARSVPRLVPFPAPAAALATGVRPRPGRDRRTRRPATPALQSTVSTC